MSSGLRHAAIVATVAMLLLSPSARSMSQEVGEGPGARVSFESRDGVTLVADFVEGSKKTAPAVILLHMYRGKRQDWGPLVPALRKEGFQVLALDLRGHGESTRKGEQRVTWKGQTRTGPNIFQEMHEDVAAALAFLEKTLGSLPPVALVGASVGCSVAVDSAARDPRVGMVVLLSPGPNYLGVDTKADLEKFGERPIVMVSDDKEEPRCQLLFEQVMENPRAIRRKLDGAGHGTRMFGKVADLGEQIAAWIARFLANPAQEKEKGA